MSATIYWEYVSAKHDTVGGGNRMAEAMERAFGPSPWRLDGDSIGVLRGLSAAHGGLDRDNPYETILRKLLDEDGVTLHPLNVWAEY